MNIFILVTDEVMIKNNEKKVEAAAKEVVEHTDDDNNDNGEDEEDEDEDLFASKDDPFKLFGNKVAPKMVRCSFVVIIVVLY